MYIWYGLVDRVVLYVNLQLNVLLSTSEHMDR